MLTSIDFKKNKPPATEEPHDSKQSTINPSSIIIGTTSLEAASTSRMVDGHTADRTYILSSLLLPLSLSSNEETIEEELKSDEV
jgi:hypothetical protein